MERSTILRNAEDIPAEQINDVMHRHPGDMDAWAHDLKTPKDSLKRHLRRVARR
ncbi:hypothetical protein [Azospirillum sp. B4]|uniref:hypothetical protein n=1 Tax=Azospirillum sp. B4 TaxID=95605 RepID=UPI0019022E74|nr:hypothetical protein [Azospirillum sp. B4]